MTCFQVSFRRALFFLEKSRKSTGSRPPEHLDAAEFGANSQFVRVGAHAYRSWATGEAVRCLATKVAQSPR
jgi:hypothetical protein